MIKNKFTKLLMLWNDKHNKRQMPWKGEKDPYKIWLSEVILQQTRVEQGWGYYEKFIEKYPSVFHLAKAKDEEVFKLWEGLGYYNRCKNLLFTARFIVEKHNGIFPSTYEEIIALKGVGSYTASAIASFAFDLPYAVVDGNVFRVLSRFFAIKSAIDSKEGKQLFSSLAQEYIDKKQPGKYNQAIMDFGATICKPALPLCYSCLLHGVCEANQIGIVNYLPIKERVLSKKNRWFYYFVFRCKNQILIHKRMQNDIWQNLYEFYLLESDESLKWTDSFVHQWIYDQFGIKKKKNVEISKIFSQQLTHQIIKGQFIEVKLNKIPSVLKHHQWIEAKELKNFPFPKFINQYSVITANQ